MPKADMAKGTNSIPSPDENCGYEVGYAKPPKENQFKKGRSGNPRGRPKGAHNKQPAVADQTLRKLILAEANREVSVIEAGKPVNMAMSQVILRSVATKAAKGDARAQQLFVTWVQKAETDERSESRQFLEAVIAYKSEMREEIEYRKAYKIPIDDIDPHPDDIHIDPETGVISIKKKLSDKQREARSTWHDRARRCDRNIIQLKKDLKDEEYKDCIQGVEDEIVFERKIRQIIVSKIGEPN